MDIQKFIQRSPYLYHLTDKANFPNIFACRKILSTKDILEASAIVNPDIFLQSRRKEHTELLVDGNKYRIRDQRPISEVVLARSLTDNWKNSDFTEHLNRHVFFWPSVDRLKKHFDRYKDEGPIILRLQTSDMLMLHPEVEFCKLNSGSTRCNASWGGKAPERGPNTFLTIDNFNHPAREVAEVTIPNFANLPIRFWTSNSPEGPWTERIKQIKT